MTTTWTIVSRDDSPYSFVSLPARLAARLHQDLSMAEDRTIWGIHLQWIKEPGEPPQDIAIGWHEIGDLKKLEPTRDAFKAAFASTFPAERPGAIPVKAEMLYRFANEMQIGDVIVFPSQPDRLIKIGLVAGDYRFQPSIDSNHPHRRRVDWKVQTQRASFSQAALYEVGSAITLFQVTDNAEEFLSALEGGEVAVAELDMASEQAVAVQVEENVEDFVIKRLMSALSHEQFEHFIAELLRCIGYHARVTRFSGDGGVDIIAHKDELGFEPPIIKVQCKHTLSTIGGPDVQNLLGAIQMSENALFVTVGEYSADARRMERNNARLRLIGRADLLAIIFGHYDAIDPRFKSLLPLKRIYAPSSGPD